MTPLRPSLLKTNLCGGVTVVEEIENCIEGYHVCLDCSELKGEIVKIIESSLENEKYGFVVDDFMNVGSCVNNITAVSQNIRNGQVRVALCR